MLLQYSGLLSIQISSLAVEESMGWPQQSHLPKSLAPNCECKEHEADLQQNLQFEHYTVKKEV